MASPPDVSGVTTAATASGPPRGGSDYASVTADDLVTGEGVALDLPAASVGLRLASGLLDGVVVILTLLAVFLLLTIAALSVSDDALFAAALVASMMVAFVAVPTTIETLTRGRSLGKRVTGLRVVRDDGGPITVWHALVRAIVGFVEIYAFTGTPAFFSVLLSTRGKRLGDYAAGTYVVRDRVRLTLPAPAEMPPPLASWARNADLAALPTGTALAVRQYLARLPTLDPVARENVGRALLADVAPHVAPPPPPGAPPAMVLAAVVAERRDRDLRRLRKDADRRARLLGHHDLTSTTRRNGQ